MWIAINTRRAGTDARGAFVKPDAPLRGLKMLSGANARSLLFQIGNCGKRHPQSGPPHWEGVGIAWKIIDARAVQQIKELHAAGGVSLARNLTWTGCRCSPCPADSPRRYSRGPGARTDASLHMPQELAGDQQSVGNNKQPGQAP